MSREDQSKFPAVVVEVGNGADYTIFSYDYSHPYLPAWQIAHDNAKAYAEKYLLYLLSAQPPIKHSIYHVKTQSDFYAIIDKRNGGEEE
tara:strand:+ start:29 stop:295 length:267 start_codon:yes stop_codon:yes gene_type:complete